MKRFSIPLVLALATLSLLAASTPAQAGERPIHAAGRGALNAPDFFASGALYGSGKGEHLGRCGLFIPLDFDELWRHGTLDTQYLQLGAASGDQLFATVDSEFDPATGILAGTITFAGGTGRFADASGSARLLIVPDTSWFYYSHVPYPIDGTLFSWALEGTIDY